MTTMRLDRLRHVLEQAGLTGAVVRQPANVYYLTGYPAAFDRPSFVVIGERTALVVPGDPGTVQSKVSSDVLVIGYAVPGSTIDRVADIDSTSADALREAAKETGLRGKRIGVEVSQVSASHVAAINLHGQVTPLGDQIAALRRIKDADEVSRIRRAVHLNDLGMGAAAQTVTDGVSEFDVMNQVVAAMQNAAGVPIDVLPATNAFISGPRTLLAAAPATPRRLERGDHMIIDINPFIDFYKGDTTRTFSVGEPPDAIRKIHDSLVRGLESAEAVMRPGAKANDVYAALVRPIIEAGYSAGIRFHGGHAMGLEHVERPYIIPGDDMPLEGGMVISLEPGVYLPEIGGVRVEDNYLITEDGCETISRYPREIIIC